MADSAVHPVVAALRDEGVDVAAVVRLDGVATGVALIVVDREGRNLIAVASGANHENAGPLGHP